MLPTGIPPAVWNPPAASTAPDASIASARTLAALIPSPMGSHTDPTHCATPPTGRPFACVNVPPATIRPSGCRAKANTSPLATPSPMGCHCVSVPLYRAIRLAATGEAALPTLVNFPPTIRSLPSDRML